MMSQKKKIKIACQRKPHSFFIIKHYQANIKCIVTAEECVKAPGIKVVAIGGLGGDRDRSPWHSPHLIVF